MTSPTCLVIFDPAVPIDDVHDPDEEVVNVDDERGHDDRKTMPTLPETTCFFSAASSLGWWGISSSASPPSSEAAAFACLQRGASRRF